MRWNGGFDDRDRPTFSAFSAVTPDADSLGFEWRVTRRRGNRSGWTVKKSAAELISDDVRSRAFETSDEAMAWCEAEEARIIAAYRERSAA